MLHHATDIAPAPRPPRPPCYILPSVEQTFRRHPPPRIIMMRNHRRSQISQPMTRRKGSMLLMPKMVELPLTA